MNSGLWYECHLIALLSKRAAPTRQSAARSKSAARLRIFRDAYGIAPALLLAALVLPFAQTQAAEPQGFLETIHHHTTLTSTVPNNGDQNPYALMVAPVSEGGYWENI